MVEFTVFAPILALLLLACFQFGAVFNDYIAVTDAARAAARRAAIDGSGTIYATAVSDAQLSAQAAADNKTCTVQNWCTTVTTSPAAPSGWAAGNPVTATVTAPYRISILGFNVITGSLSHSVTMRIQLTSPAAS
jgi:Flp pilus assembly protein TadG